jgi:hypothetical protein
VGETLTVRTPSGIGVSTIAVNVGITTDPLTLHGDHGDGRLDVVPHIREGARVTTFAQPIDERSECQPKAAIHVFELTKWYLDIVTDEGDALIAYAARLNIEGLRVSYASTLFSRPAERDIEKATIRGVTCPVLNSGECAWQSRPLDVEGTWHRESPAIERTLIETPDGSIRWTCHMPRARATFRHRQRALHGRGYVECLTMTVAPWKLPFRTLRWGRHTSDQHSLVWIDWDRGDAGRWIWLDGVEQPGARLADTGVTGLSGGGELHLRDSRDVRDRRVLAGISGVIRALRPHATSPLAGMHEHKQLSSSAITGTGHAMDRGEALHEVVTW